MHEFMNAIFYHFTHTKDMFTPLPNIHPFYARLAWEQLSSLKLSNLVHDCGKTIIIFSLPPGQNSTLVQVSNRAISS
jgi:hypothetical protein